MQKYYAIVKAGGFGLNCPACGGVSQAKHKRKGVETATEICPHCKVKIETRYEPEDDLWWDQQKVKVMESNRDRVNLETLQNLTGKDRENFERGLRNLGMTNPADKADLRTAFKRYKPNATDRELDIMASGEAPEDSKPEWIV